MTPSVSAMIDRLGNALFDRYRAGRITFFPAD